MGIDMCCNLKHFIRSFILRSYSHIIGGTSSISKGVLPRVAAKLDVSALTDGDSAHFFHLHYPLV